jgi:hypothetical protein
MRGVRGGALLNLVAVLATLGAVVITGAFLSDSVFESPAVAAALVFAGLAAVFFFVFEMISRLVERRSNASARRDFTGYLRSRHNSRRESDEGEP